MHELKNMEIILWNLAKWQNLKVNEVLPVALRKLTNVSENWKDRFNSPMDAADRWAPLHSTPRLVCTRHCPAVEGQAKDYSYQIPLQLWGQPETCPLPRRNTHGRLETGNEAELCLCYFYCQAQLWGCLREWFWSVFEIISGSSSSSLLFQDLEQFCKHLIQTHFSRVPVFCEWNLMNTENI